MTQASMDPGDPEEFCPNCFAGQESSEHHEKCETDRPAGYIIAERHVTGPYAGRLDADWDGEIHETREAADAELARANAALGDDPTRTPVEHWRLYELWEAQ